MRVFVTVAVMALGCAPAMEGLNPPPLSFVLSMDFPQPAVQEHRAKGSRRHLRRKNVRKPKGSRPKLPVMIIVGTDRGALVRRGLVWAANLVSGIKKSFDDGSFAAYLFYVNDLSPIQKAGPGQYLKMTAPIPVSQVKAGDIVAIKGCLVGRDIGVVTAVCEQGFFVTSYCSGRVESRFIKVKTTVKDACKHKVRSLDGKVVGYRRAR